jgi:hypothetical protein
MALFYAREVENSLLTPDCVLDESHPLADGLGSFNIFYGGVPIDLVSRQPVNLPYATSSASMGVVHSNYGTGLHMNLMGLNHYLQNNNWTKFTTTKNGTMAVGAAPGPITRGIYLASMRIGSGNRYYLQRSTAGNVAYGYAGSATVASGPAWPIRKYATVAMEWDGSNTARAFYDGTQFHSTTGTMSGTVNTCALACVSNLPATTEYRGNFIFWWFALWNKSIGAEAHRMLSENPYQMFKRPVKRRIFTPAPVITQIQLSNPAVTDIGSVSARPIVNVSYL